MNNSKSFYSDFDGCIKEALETKDPEEALIAYYDRLNYEEKVEFKNRLRKLDIKGIDTARLLYEIGGN